MKRILLVIATLFFLSGWAITTKAQEEATPEQMIHVHLTKLPGVTKLRIFDAIVPFIKDRFASISDPLIRADEEIGRIVYRGILSPVASIYYGKREMSAHYVGTIDIKDECVIFSYEGLVPINDDTWKEMNAKWQRRADFHLTFDKRCRELEKSMLKRLTAIAEDEQE